MRVKIKNAIPETKYFLFFISAHYKIRNEMPARKILRKKNWKLKGRPLGRL
jgi:hypothetical protein